LRILRNKSDLFPQQIQIHPVRRNPVIQNLARLGAYKPHQQRSPASIFQPPTAHERNRVSAGCAEADFIQGQRRGTLMLKAHLLNCSVISSSTASGRQASDREEYRESAEKKSSARKIPFRDKHWMTFPTPAKARKCKTKNPQREELPIVISCRKIK